jgi:hypothetical protein
MACLGGMAWLAAAGALQAADFEWTGATSSDASNASNWFDVAAQLPAATVPGSADNVFIRNGGSASTLLDLGSSSPTWRYLNFNHADNGTTVAGSGTITINLPGADQDTTTIQSQGGERLSTIHPNIVTNGKIQANNGHDLVFEGEVSANKVFAFDGTEVTFNGTFNHMNPPGANFFYGHPNSVVRVNADFYFYHPSGDGFGLGNGIGLAIGANAFLGRYEGPTQDFQSGLGSVDMYNGSFVRLEGDNLIGTDTDLFSRYNGGGDPNNTFDLNGHSDAVELLGTHPSAVFTIDFGATPGANSLLWIAAHNMELTASYKVTNFEIGTDTLQLGTVGSLHWSPDDEISPDIELTKSLITINNIPYAAPDSGLTTPYWTIVDYVSSRNVEFFNLAALPDGDYNNDGRVDGRDFLLWQRGQSPNPLSAGDLQAWQANYGGGSLAAVSAAVPEPACAVLFLLGLVSVLGTRRVCG